ncbi:iron uptake porin [Coleofasciculus sp.]|uniref:iron uptake porin n=1 Tax=Coleofasciculus sp. TaxID=3100458 RepID=UPI0039FB6521
MIKLGVSLPLSSVILGCNLLVLPPVLAQENNTNTTVPEIEGGRGQEAKGRSNKSDSDSQAYALPFGFSLGVRDAMLFDHAPQTLRASLHPRGDAKGERASAVARLRTSGDSTPPDLESLNGSSVEVLNPCSMRSQQRLQDSIPSASCPLPSASLAQPQIPEIPTNPLESPQLYSQPPDLMEDFTRVEDLRDVSPGDWAYEALRSLVEKYRCIAGSGQGTFEGNRAITRYEFAAAFNTCLLKIGRIIYSLNNTFPNQEDLAVVQRLQADFATELETLTTQLDDLEQRVDFLNENQFSTTTVVRGTVDFNLISAFGEQKAVASGGNPREDLNENLTLSARVNLNFDTSFTGKDRLRTNIRAGNVSNFGNTVTGTDMTRLIGAVNTGNDVRIGSLFYEFPIGGRRGKVAIAPAADFPTRIFPALNPVSPISNFGAESPIYSFAFGTGAVVYYNFTDQFAAGVSYLTTSGGNPVEGLFGGQYTALAQVTYTPSDKLAIAFTYGHYYAPEPGATVNVTGSKGSRFAQLPFGGSTATSSNAYGLQSTYKLSDRLILGGWVSYFNARAESSPVVNGLDGSIGANADIWSWAFTAVVPDLGKLGSQLNFVLGMPPKVTSNDVASRLDRDTSMHFELSYRYPISNRIFITPGVFLITNPEHNAANGSIWIGLLRTTFTF